MLATDITYQSRTTFSTIQGKVSSHDVGMDNIIDMAHNQIDIAQIELSL